MLGTTEIIIIAGVVLLLFGSTAIPKFFRSIGKAKTELRKGMKEAEIEAKAETVSEKKDDT